MEEEDMKAAAQLQELEEEHWQEAQPSWSQLSEYSRRLKIFEEHKKYEEKAKTTLLEEDVRSKQEFVNHNYEDGAASTPKMTIEVETLDEGPLPPDEQLKHITREIYKAREFDKDGVLVYGYVYDITCKPVVDMMLRKARARHYESVVGYVLAEHFNAKCQDMWDTPTDHWHLLVWFKCGKPTDSKFHRKFFECTKKGVSWNSSLIYKPTSMMQYVQCEPRIVIQMWLPPSVKKEMEEAWENRTAMKDKIEKRDSKKENPVKKRKWAENDWFAENGSNPQSFTEHIIEHGCTNVSSFLMYAKRFIKDQTYGSFIFSRDKARLEKEINDAIKRHYYMFDYFECLETRRKQLDDLVARGGMYSVKASITWLELVLQLNHIDKWEFVVSVVDVLLKSDQKRNCLYLWGPANSLKSTICRSIVGGCPNIGMQISSTEFPFNECTMVNLIFSEETKITHDIVCLLKRVYEGAYCSVNHKK